LNFALTFPCFADSATGLTGDFAAKRFLKSRQESVNFVAIFATKADKGLLLRVN